ncbi:BlaI/MecI/CopY family transcriptional regulator [Alloiococcus sp. CFN-8]|uniref:BlaI/MecI/CopY family transcriptional regulator n=1 Tax=Alloiococcus sp. CFN-8 TaxID=3416081 RepID=UPI003CF3EA0A
MKNLRRLPDGELEVMQIIWHGDTPMPRSVIEKELTESKHLAPTTILTFLTRLCDKGYLTMEKQGRINYYTPLISEKDYLASESRNILNRLYGGSLSAFAVSLADGGVSREEIEELRRLLEEGTL